MKPVGKPDAGKLHVRFDERGGETERTSSVTAPLLDSTQTPEERRGGRGSDCGSGEPADLVHVLSPFDPLIIQRKRTKLIFDYDHRFEAYVPSDKRQFGYFALPVRVGEEIVAAIDRTPSRGTGVPRIQD